MATLNTPVQFRLTRVGRVTLKVATLACRCGFKLPGRLVKSVVNRSWEMRLGDGEWKSIRMAPGGRVIA